jgi:hypothetical protein
MRLHDRQELRVDSLVMMVEASLLALGAFLFSAVLVCSSARFSKKHARCYTGKGMSVWSWYVLLVCRMDGRLRIDVCITDDTTVA